MKEYDGRMVKFLCTSKCNIKCEHCLVCYKGERDPEELLNIVRSLKNKYKVLLNGAEVLTNLGYLKSYKEVGQTWISTNGLALLKPETIIALKENNINSVSISYHFGIHDEISKVKQAILDEIINIVKNSGLNFRLMTTIDAENYQLIEYMCKAAHEMGARGIMFNNLISIGNGVNLDKSLLLTDEQLKSFFTSLNTVRKIYDKNVLIIERGGTFGRDENSTKNHFCCDYGINKIFVSPDNNVYPCIFMTNPGHEIGKFIDGKIMIYDDYTYDHNKCVAQEVCNHGKSLNKVLSYNKR